jgi:hypothetical protein
MFFPTILSFYKGLNFFQKFFFYLLVALVWVIHVPRFNNLALLNYANNFKYIVWLASFTPLPWKFIDFSLDACEMYYKEHTILSEISYYGLLLLKTPKKFKTICLISLLYIFWKDWKKIFFFWLYSISLPFIFFFIILYIDYIEGYLD